MNMAHIQSIEDAELGNLRICILKASAKILEAGFLAKDYTIFVDITNLRCDSVAEKEVLDAFPLWFRQRVRPRRVRLLASPVVEP